MNVYFSSLFKVAQNIDGGCLDSAQSSWEVHHSSYNEYLVSATSR